MELRRLWKFVMNPAVEVVAAIAVVLFAAWVVLTAEADTKKSIFPIPAAHK